MALLKRCGSPILVASRYRPQTSLIGPVLFPIYEFVLKLVLLWVLVPVFILIVGPALILSAADHAGAFFTTIRTLWTTLFMTAAVITLVFAALERTGTKLHLEDRWDKRSLPQLPKQPQLPSTTHTIFELVFALLGIVWLLAVPHYPFLLFGPAAAFLQPAPLWNTFYGPLVVLAFLSLARHGIQVARPQWTWFPPTAQLFSTVVGLMVVKYLIDAASKPLNGEWHPFVVLGSSISTDRAACSCGGIRWTPLCCSPWLPLGLAFPSPQSSRQGNWCGICGSASRVCHPVEDPALMRLL